MEIKPSILTKDICNANAEARYLLILDISSIFFENLSYSLSSVENAFTVRIFEKHSSAMTDPSEFKFLDFNFSFFTCFYISFVNNK